MTFTIPRPHRDLPIDAVRVTDPATGATYLRPRRRPKTPNTNSHGEPLPATCSTPFCEQAGLPHDECSGGPHFDPYYTLPARYVPAEALPSYYCPVIPLPQTELGVHSGADQNAFQRWLQSFPYWQIPREMPPDWKNPSRSESQYRPGPIQMQYTPHRSANHLPYLESIHPVYATPRRRPQAVPVPVVPVASPWTNALGLPNCVPDVVEWNNVKGGKLQWTPHPWVAHPLPHPDIPAQAFWDASGSTSTLHPWRGPGGWSPRSGLDAERMYLITGGHPLPGMDPYWTPTLWNPPLYSPRIGVYISPWLAPNPRDANVPHILWDAAVEPPYRIRRVTSRGGIVDFANTDFFKQSATYPDVKTLQIHLLHMRNSWGPVIINKDSPIEVGDIFNAVWEYLHKPITQSDWQAIHASGWQRCKRIEYAMFRRCWSAAGLYDYVVSQGIKRVDLMEGNTVYWGTYLTYNADSTWFLTMGFLPETRTA